MSGDTYDDQNPLRSHRRMLHLSKLIVMAVAFATIVMVTLREYWSGRLPRELMLAALLILIPSSLILIDAFTRAFRVKRG